VPSVLAPFPDIAVHVVEAEGIGREGAYRGGFLAVFARRRAVVAVVAVEVGLVRADACSEVEGGAGAGTAGVFPFRFAGQPVGVAALPTQPGAIGLGLVPGHIDQRHPASAPGGFRLGGPSGGAIAVVVVEGHAGDAQGVGAGDVNFVLRAFAGIAFRFIRWRAHAEAAGGDDHHLRTFAADFQGGAEGRARCEYPGRGGHP